MLYTELWDCGRNGKIHNWAEYFCHFFFFFAAFMELLDYSFSIFCGFIFKNIKHWSSEKELNYLDCQTTILQRVNYQNVSVDTKWHKEKNQHSSKMRIFLFVISIISLHSLTTNTIQSTLKWNPTEMKENVWGGYIMKSSSYADRTLPLSYTCKHLQLFCRGKSHVKNCTIRW